MNQLLQVFNGIDVVVRWWTNQANSGSGVTRFCYRRIHLVPRKLAAFAGLCTLSHFDLQVVGIHQVFASHTKTTRCNLLDG